MKGVKRVFLVVVVILVLVLGFLFYGGSTARPASPAATSGPAAALASEDSSPPAQPSRTERKESSRPVRKTAAPPALESRPLEEIRKSLIGQAHEVIEKDLGGADEAAKQDLMASVRNLEALVASGVGPYHPTMLHTVATFSRKLDRLGAYDESAWRSEIAGYLEKRLAEVEALADGESPAALRERWAREFNRDDAPEAIVLRSFDGSSTKEKLRDGMLKMIQGFSRPPAR